MAHTVLSFLSVGSPTGVKFAVEHGQARALFDLGLEYLPGRVPFSLGLRPREGRALEDLQAVGMAPRDSGVLGGWDGRTSVFISHLHLDHSALVQFMDPEAPLYYPLAMEELRLACSGAGYLPWREPAGTAVADRGRVQLDQIEVEFVAVDHDLPGASGFLIRTPDLALAYTADHRWHGLHSELTAGFAGAARGTDVLILEATGAGLGTPNAAVPLGEHEVAARFDSLLDEAEALVLLNLYPMNRERARQFGETAARHGRRLLMRAPAAEVAGWPHILEDLAEVRREPSRYCLQLGFRDLPHLIDLAPPPGSLYVHSNGPPMGELDPAFPVLRAWIELFGLRAVALNSSGHSWPEDLARMVELVRPGVVLPVHTLRPEALEVPGIPRLLPESRRPYTASTGLARVRPG